MIDELKLGVEHAEAIIESGIEFKVYTDDMPDSKKDKIEAAHEIVTYAIDGWTNDGITPDNEDPDTAEAGTQIKEILDIAGVTINEDDEIEFGDLPELISANGDGPAADADSSDDGEAAFDPDDIIDDWSSKKTSEAIEAFEAVMNGDGLYAEDVQNLLAWENDLEKPRARIIETLTAALPEDAEDGDTTTEPEAEAGEEPLEGYDSAAIKDIKEALIEAVNSEDEEERIDSEFMRQVLAYEEANKNRASFVKWLNEAIAELETPEGEGEEEEAPVKKGVKVGGKAKQPPADDDEEDEAPKTKAKAGGKAKAAEEPEGEIDEDDIIGQLPAGLARVHAQSQLKLAAIQKAGLDVAEEYEGNMPELPDDISTVNHDDLSNLLLNFQSALSVATTQASAYYVDADTYEEIADYLENVALLNSEESNDTKRKAEARTDDLVVFFRGRQKESYHRYVQFRDLAGQLAGKVKAVSRVGGFKDDEEGGGDAKVQTPAASRGSGKGATAKTAGKVAEPKAKTTVAKPRTRLRRGS